MEKIENPFGDEYRDVDDELGWRREKKRREKERREMVRKTGVALFLQDPVAVFGYDIMIMILSRADARSVALSLLVSHSWNGVASSDKIWGNKCEELWRGKAHIPRSSQVQGLSKLNAYSYSAVDGKRSRITREDLCDHAWEFHFNEAAPEYWRNLDPYWKGTVPLMRRYFHPDGSVTADPADEVWGGHECCYTIVTSIMVEKNQIREHYVRINRSPRLSVSRKLDWSWEMSNTIFSYSSVSDTDRDGGTGPPFVFTRVAI